MRPWSHLTMYTATIFILNNTATMVAVNNYITSPLKNFKMKRLRHWSQLLDADLINTLRPWSQLLDFSLTQNNTATLVAVSDCSLNKINCDLDRSCCCLVLIKYTATLVAVAGLYESTTSLRPWSQLVVFINNQQQHCDFGRS